MGLLKGNLSFLRYQVVGVLPQGFRMAFEERLQKRAFVEKLDARNGEENIGWVNVLNPDDSDLNLNAFMFSSYLVLGLRIDKKRVDGAFFRIMCQRRFAEVLEAKGVERLGASHKRDIKEAVEEDLLQRALPQVRVFDMAWDLDSGEVRFFGTSAAVADIFRIFFRDTFEMELIQLKLAHSLIRGGMGPQDISQGVEQLSSQADFRA